MLSGRPELWYYGKDLTNRTGWARLCCSCPSSCSFPLKHPHRVNIPWTLHEGACAQTHNKKSPPNKSHLSGQTELDGLDYGTWLHAEGEGPDLVMPTTGACAAVARHSTGYWSSSISIVSQSNDSTQTLQEATIAAVLLGWKKLSCMISKWNIPWSHELVESSGQGSYGHATNTWTHWIWCIMLAL